MGRLDYNTLSEAEAYMSKQVREDNEVTMLASRRDIEKWVRARFAELRLRC